MGDLTNEAAPGTKPPAPGLTPSPVPPSRADAQAPAITEIHPAPPLLVAQNVDAPPLTLGGDRAHLLQPMGPFIRLAMLWMGGVAVGHALQHAWLWLALGVAAVALAMRSARRSRASAPMAIAVIAAAAGWSVLATSHVPSDHISRFLTPDAQLAHVRGTIVSAIHLSTPQRGSFGQFSFESPRTLFEMQVEAIEQDSALAPASGTLLVRIKQLETSLHLGDQVAVRGWMQSFDGPSNPGELDYRKLMTDRGIDGQITLNVRGNCEVMEHGGGAGFTGFRQSVADAAFESLHIGLKREPRRIAFLETILLGRWSKDLEDLNESFQRTGLTHILSISGAHLTMLMGLVWLVVRWLVPHPGKASVVVLVVLALYLLAVPWRAPILRAGLMASLLCAGWGLGRKVRGIDMIALAAVLILIWRPDDLFNAGAQLSFLIVAALLVFTQPVSQWLWRDPPVIGPADHLKALVARRITDYVAVNLVAFVVSIPLVAFHFQMVAPLSMILSFLSLPVVTAVIGLGYLKILVGLILPSAGELLSGPLEWTADSMTGLVQHASTWPGATMPLNSSPSALWLLATMGVTVALLAGWFAGRRAAMGLALLICTTWLLLPHHPRPAAAIDSIRQGDSFGLNMFAVGDGSCFLLRTGGRAALFDCGSNAYLDVGERSIVPALRALNVRRIDDLFISHADLDHFCGVLDVMKAFPVRRALMPPQMLSKAQADLERSGAESSTPLALLLSDLRRRGIPVEPIARGWREEWDSAQLDLLWPPADYDVESDKRRRDNDASMVLSIRAHGRRVLLNGDLDKASMPDLLALGDDLRTDITDLPHHGSFVQASPDWIKAAAPRIVLQSSGPARLRSDKWSPHLPSHVTRLVTAQRGMVEVHIEASGEISWTTFRTAPEPEIP